MRQMISGVLAGVISAFLGVLFVGYSAAITIPKGFVNFPGGWRMLLWEVLVVQFLGYGITVLLFTFLAAMLLDRNPWITAGLVVIGCEAALAIAYPSSFFLYIPHILIVVSCAFLGAAISRKLGSA